jgi:hypothetical protein
VLVKQGDIVWRTKFRDCYREASRTRRGCLQQANVSHYIEKVSAKDGHNRADTLTELSATMVAEDSQVISGNYWVRARVTEKRIAMCRTFDSRKRVHKPIEKRIEKNS